MSNDLKSTRVSANISKTTSIRRKKLRIFLLVKDCLILGILPLCFEAFLHLVYFYLLAVISVYYCFKNN